MGDSPYISFVVVARNDNYGGDFLHRINVFVKVLLTLCEKYKLPSELIIVEWNPPEDRARLKDAISWPDIQRKHCQIRIIEVPNEIHKKLPNPNKLPLFEYIGKNVGVRRGNGEYILSTNPDVIFSEEVIKFLAERKLSAKCFYRIDRYDVKSPVPFDIPVEKQLKYCVKNIVRVLGYWDCYDNKLNEKFNLYRSLRALAGHLKRKLLFYPFAPPHRNASGDFFVMHRDHWEALKGYPEFKGLPHHIDSYMVNMALFYGVRQVILGSPLRIYHMDHGRPEGGKPWLPELRSNYQRMMKERQPIIINEEIWALGRHELPETLIVFP